MTEQELTALAKQTLDWLGRGRPHYAVQLAAGYLTLLAERDALKAEIEQVQEREAYWNQRCFETEAKLTAVEAERDQLKAQRNQLHEALSFRDLQADGGLLEAREVVPAEPMNLRLFQDEPNGLWFARGFGYGGNGKTPGLAVRDLVRHRNTTEPEKWPVEREESRSGVVPACPQCGNPKYIRDEPHLCGKCGHRFREPASCPSSKERQPCERYLDIWRVGLEWLKVLEGAVCPRCGFSRAEHAPAPPPGHV